MLTRDQKDEALRTIATRLKSKKELIATENLKDLEAARASGTSEALIDRLILNGERIEAIADFRSSISTENPSPCTPRASDALATSTSVKVSCWSPTWKAW